MKMDHLGSWTLLAAITTAACGSTTVSPAARDMTALFGPATPPSDATASPNGEGRDGAAAAQAAATLPVAPWTDAPLATRDVPAPLMAAWRRADNRTWCAPLAPRSLGASQGARPRRGTMVDGGWSIEFDRPGAPGLGPDGRACPRCGHGTFGIVGAALTPDEAFAPDSTAPAFRDGSRAQFEAPSSEGEPAAATLSIAGQGCVYQVWSFLGEEHLRGLVGDLRFVETGRETLAMDE